MPSAAMQPSSACLPPRERRTWFRCSSASKPMRACPPWLGSCLPSRPRNTSSYRRESTRSMPSSRPGIGPMNAADVSPRSLASAGGDAGTDQTPGGVHPELLVGDDGSGVELLGQMAGRERVGAVNTLLVGQAFVGGVLHDGLMLPAQGCGL